MDIKVAEEAGVEPTEDAYAPSNGFEARAPHRERYSSSLIIHDFSAMSFAIGCAVIAGICVPRPKQFSKLGRSD